MELTLDQALQKGIEAHRAGKAQEADLYYTAIIKARPKHPDANHNMGVLAVGVGKVETALPFFKTAIEANPKIEQFWLSYIDALIKLDRMAEAKAVFDQAKSAGMKGDKLDQIECSLDVTDIAPTNNQDPPANQIQSLIDLYIQGQLKQALADASLLLTKFPNSVTLLNIAGSANQGLGELEEAIKAYKTALSIKPDYAEAYYNMGNALKEQGKLEEALDAYNKALSIKPDYAEVYNNLGTSLRDQGKQDEAIEAYNKSLTIKPGTPDVCKNLGNALNDQGNFEEAIEAFNKALSIKPDYAEAHRILSSIKKYTEYDKHFLHVQKLYKRDDLNDDARCNLSFALAKMYEDIGKLDQSCDHLSKGNALRKKLLRYSISQDKKLFTKVKNTQPHLLKNSLEIEEKSIETTPIFVLGMPRSGTTLVEQIISSHSEVGGAGELRYVSRYGYQLSIGSLDIQNESISDFRKKYLLELSKISNGKHFITDKMPQNFRFIPLICAAFPEAKIIHVQRSATATCWSNYKHYFASKDLGYCYDLKDVVEYYNLYKELMNFWQADYSDRIFSLNYENLTTVQENQTRKLIAHLGLTWEEACLSPHKNKRSIKTAAQQQVRQKVYQGSSEAWRKFEPYLNGAFDGLPS